MIKTTMLLKDFDYQLPADLIAQTPSVAREKSRLMLVNRQTKKIEHLQFEDLPDLLPSKSVLVFNDTKVIKARLFTKRETGGTVEVFLLEPLDKEHLEIWTALISPVKRLKKGERLHINKSFFVELIQKDLVEGQHKVKIYYNGNFYEQLNKYGNVPLPPYIKASQTQLANQFNERYQTIFAQKEGAVAAPTASLHFNETIIKQCQKNQIDQQSITLHVGLGTFSPIKTEHIEDHKIHSEYYQVTKKTAQELTLKRKNNNKIIAVGTTVARTLETIYEKNTYQSSQGKTDIFLYPGIKCKGFDGLITNFHLPKSSLLLLVSSFSSIELMNEAYQKAIEEKYRFFSFGDAMLIL